METIGEQQPSFNPNASTPGGSATSRFTLSHNSKNTIEQVCDIDFSLDDSK